MTSLWEFAVLNENQLECLAKIDGANEASSSAAASTAGKLSISSSSSSSSYGASSSASSATTNSGGEEPHTGLQNSLNTAEQSCSIFIQELDSILKTLSEVGSAYDDVTGRTNSLMVNCESLLEQQRTLESTAEVLRKTLQPFSELETVASLLGIPFDARGLPTGNDLPAASATSGPYVIDPRSPEFHDLLSRLSKAMTFLNDHRELYDSSRYYRWLEQLSNRATSLVAKAMRELLENAAKLCQEAEKRSRLTQRVANAHHAKAEKSSVTVVDDTPIESHPLYQKFRGLGFRMQELGLLLRPAEKDKEEGSDKFRDHSGAVAGERRRSVSYGGGAVRGHDPENAITDVKQSYASLRTQLLIPFIKEISLSAALESSANSGRESPAPTAVKSRVALSPGIRHAYSTLLRITQLEQQLFDTLFGGLSTSVENGPEMSLSTDSSKNSEILAVIESVCNVVGDHLRPLIIKESSVDELCRVITTLAEDIRSQIIAMNVPRPLLLKLLGGLDRTVNDAQERLSYCSEVRLRSDVVLFEPSPADLQYPSILSAAVSEPKGNSVLSEEESIEKASSMTVSEDMSKTWYPPLRDTLGLLSKLYGVVEMAVFEDFARRCVVACVSTLKRASEEIKKASGDGQINGDLFLVRHLLVLREQLLPFEIRMQGTEKKLDFRPTLTAATKFVSNARSVLRMDVSNGLIQLAREGLPGLLENQRDAKRDLDAMLKASCLDLKQSSLKVLIAPLNSFIAKVEAFVGAVPVDVGDVSSTLLANEDNAAELSPENAALLKAQAFVRPERIKEMLDHTLKEAAAAGPGLQSTLRLYIDNSVARTILMKPVQLEVDLVRRKVQCIVASCVDAGTPRRELETLLRDCYTSILAELSQ